MEYPKVLYRAGEHKTVDDAEQEDAARAEGFADWAEDHAATEAAAITDAEVAADPADDVPTVAQLREIEAHLRGVEARQQAKEDELVAREHAVAAREEAVAAAEQAAAAAEQATQQTEHPAAEPTRDELKARAAELGIEHAKNITTEALAALVAAAQG